MIDAYMCAPCGHTFCGTCIQILKDTQNIETCQSCRTRINVLCKNRFVERIMCTVNGKCKACSSVIPLSAASEHVENGCDKIPTKCGQCSVVLPRCEQDQHKLECPMALKTCECGEQFLQQDEAIHKETACGCKEVSCLFACGASVKR